MAIMYTICATKRGFIYTHTRYVPPTEWNTNKKILHLVLYSPDIHYDSMKEEALVYYNSLPNVVTIYYYNTPDVSTPAITGPDLKIPGLEPGGTGLGPSVIEKLIESLLFFKKDFHHYAGIVRSNVSTLIHFPRLLTQLQSHSDIHYGGPLLNLHEPWPYISGTVFCFSMYVADLLTTSQHQLDRHIYEDVAIGKFINEHTNIKPIAFGTLAFDNESTATAWRHKTDKDRSKDVQAIKDKVCLLQCDSSSKRR